MKYCPICGTRYPDDAQFCFHDGAVLVQAAAGPDDPFIGRILADRYEILSKLGEGGMGSVYAACHRILGRIDAVKVLRPEAAQADAGRRFLREAKLAARINHPNAVVIHDFGQTESGETFLAMEYIQGQSLAKLLQRESPFPVERVASIVRQVASALDAAHQLGIIHRDLKPDNIMVMDGDRVKVVDFGIAKAIGGQESMVPMTQVGFVVGTPPYMSPEQVAGEPLDARSDVYSLALVAYEMLTGARAFDGDSMQAQMAARLSDVPRPMSVAAPHVTIPAGVEAVVRQALSRLPAQRPASAGAFAIQLEKALAVAASTQAMTSSPSGGTPTQFREATLATGGERPPVTVRSAPAGVGEGFRPPSLPNVAPGASATVAQTTPLQPSAAPAPPAVAPAPQTYPPLPAYPPLPTTNTSKTNVWLIRGVAVAVGIVLLFLVIGVAIYVAVSPSPVAVEEKNVPSVQGGKPKISRSLPDRPIVEEENVPSVQGGHTTGVAAILQASRSQREVGNYDAALRLVDEALATNPTSPELRIEKAEILFEQEHFVESEDIVYTVLHSHPDYAPAYQCLGVLQYRQGKIADAIANQKRCLQLNPEPEYACYAHANLAQFYAEQYLSDKRKFAAQSEEAEMEARAALSTATRKSLEVLPRLVLVILFVDRGQLALAREQIAKLLQDNAFKQDQVRAAVYGQLAVVAFRERNYAEAAEAAERAAQLDPQNNNYKKLVQDIRRRYRG